MFYENFLFLFRYLLYGAILYALNFQTVALISAVSGVLGFIFHYVYGIFPMSGIDEMWLFDHPANRCTIVGSVIADKFDGETMREFIIKRAAQKQHLFRSAMYPIVEWFGTHFYQNKLDKNYLREGIISVSESIPTREALAAKMAQLQQEPFTPGKPRWNFFMFEDYLDNKQSVIMWKIHHSVGDGMALTTVFLSLTDQFPNLKIPQLPKATGLQKFFIDLTLPVTYFYYAIKTLFRTADKNILHRRRLSGKKVAHIGTPITLQPVKDYCHKNHISLNEFFLAAYTLAMKQYVPKVHGKEHALNKITLAIPFSVRNIPTDGSLLPLNNDFAVLSMAVPLKSDDLKGHLATVGAIFHEMKSTIEPYVILFIQKSSSIFPTRFAEWMFRHSGKKQTAVYSNLPGPKVKMTFDDKECHELNYFVPALSNIGLGISMYSYGPKICHACFGDDAVVKEPKLMCQLFEGIVSNALKGE